MQRRQDNPSGNGPVHRVQPARGIPAEALDQDALRVVSRLTRQGHEAYLVGGCVRDLLLDRELELARDPSRGFAAPAGYQVHLFASFDERGVPVRYRRVVGGTSRWAEWTQCFAWPQPSLKHNMTRIRGASPRQVVVAARVLGRGRGCSKNVCHRK